MRTRPAPTSDELFDLMPSDAGTEGDDTERTLPIDELARLDAGGIIFGAL